MIELVGKIGSMALIDTKKNDIDYNVFKQISMALRPGFVWVTSGATEIGRLDYIKRAGKELDGCLEDNKTDYAAQGQSIIMQKYREAINSHYHVRQFLVEHQHFNNKKKREHFVRAITRAAIQGAIPIINYNDPLSDDETRKLEIQSLKEKRSDVAECIDNDETASKIASLLKAKTLLILSNIDGIYYDRFDPTSLIKSITAPTLPELLAKIDTAMDYCKGASRQGAGGAYAKLGYIKDAVKSGSKVIIASAKYPIEDIIRGLTPQTLIGLGN